MRLLQRSNQPVSTALLGIAELGLTVGTAAAIAASWGGRYWAFGSGVDVVIASTALLRRRRLAWAAVVAAVRLGNGRWPGRSARPSTASSRSR